MHDFCLVYVTCATSEEAEKLARLLLERRLIGCANIYAPIRSLYWWQNAIETAQEVVLILKAPRAYYQEIEKTLLSHHSYKNPAILQLPIVEGSVKYLEWLAQETEYNY